MKKTLLLTMIAMGIGLHGGVEYNKESNTIFVKNYPQDMPCTLENVLQSDTMNDWNKIKYDEKTKTYTINANLVIGSDDGSTTYFQIGTDSQPETTVVMHGDIVLYPDHPPIKENEKWSVYMRKKAHEAVNCLRIGSLANPAIKTTIKFADTKTFMVGNAPNAAKRPYSGEFYLYNATVTALDPDNGARIGPNRDYTWVTAYKAEIVGCKIMWFRNGINGIHGWEGRHLIKDTEYHNCGNGINGYIGSPRHSRKLVNCKFINCAQALNGFSGGGKDSVVVLENCEFSNNQRNWANIRNLKLILKNCVIGKPAEETPQNENFTIEIQD